MHAGTFIVYLAANVGLAFSNNFVTLTIFRGIQAAGSAATISVGKCEIHKYAGYY